MIIQLTKSLRRHWECCKSASCNKVLKNKTTRHNAAFYIWTASCKLNRNHTTRVMYPYMQLFSYVESILYTKVHLPLHVSIFKFHSKNIIKVFFSSVCQWMTSHRCNTVTSTTSNIEFLSVWLKLLFICQWLIYNKHLDCCKIALERSGFFGSIVVTIEKINTQIIMLDANLS